MGGSCYWLGIWLQRCLQWIDSPKADWPLADKRWPTNHMPGWVVCSSACKMVNFATIFGSKSKILDWQWCSQVSIDQDCVRFAGVACYVAALSFLQWVGQHCMLVWKGSEWIQCCRWPISWGHRRSGTAGAGSGIGWSSSSWGGAWIVCEWRDVFCIFNFV